VRVPQYPDAPRLDLVDDLHGRSVPDPYRWLESGDAGDDALRAAWSAEQAALYDAEAAGWTTSEHWRARVGDLLRSGGVGPPAHRGDRTFFMRREPDGNMAVLWTIDPDGTERVLIDPMALDPEGHTTLDSFQPSKEGHLLAYQLSVGGTEEPDLFVMDVATGERLEGPIDRVRFTPVAWLPGAEAYYYVRRLDPSLVPEDERQFHRRVYLHRLGADPSTDVEIFGAGRTITNYYGVSVSMDGRWLQVSSQEGTEPRNDLWVADLAASTLEEPALVPVQIDVDAQTGIWFGRDGRFYVHTDRDAPRGRLAVVDPATPTYEHWVDLLPEDPEAVLEDFAVLDGPEMPQPRLLATWTRHGVGEMTLHELATGERLSDVDLPGVGTLGGLVARPEGGPLVWFVYTDYTTPSNVYLYDGRTGAITLHASPPGHVDVPKVFSRQETFTSKDGTTVRMFVLSPADGVDRPRPTLLSGYGGFGISMQPAYSATSLAWVEAGGVYAVACIRGGGDEGEEWHRDGMLGSKQNVFDDFFAAQEHLIATGRTTSDQLAVIGGSNGGLLMGAQVTQRPELARTVVCQAPLLDMIRYTTSQLGATWTVEYGDPAVPEQLDWLLSYSPYHNVPEGTDFPALLMMVFDNDSRTDPMHGRKFVAAVQHADAGERPIVLRTEANVGHGARSVSKSVDEIAEWMAFVARWTGLRAG
jgi:prolyl oligopeptidase